MEPPPPACEQELATSDAVVVPLKRLYDGLLTGAGVTALAFAAGFLCGCGVGRHSIPGGLDKALQSK